MSLLINSVFTDNGNEIMRSETEEERKRFKIEELKQLCLNMINEDPDYFDSRDVETLKSGDIGVTLFLEANDWRVDSSFEALKRHCCYRRENKVLDLKMTDFPRELYQTGLFVAKGFDRSGHPLVFIRLAVSPGFKEINSLIVKNFLLVAEIVRNKVLSTNKKVGVIFDCRQAQVDIGLLKEVLEIFTKKYPPSTEYIAFLDMNFSFKMILQVIKYFFPKYLWSKMIFIDQPTLNSMIDKDNLPTYLGGEIETLSKTELSEVPSLMDYAKLNNIKDKVAEKMLTHLKKQIAQ